MWFQINMFFECSLLSRETIQVEKFSSNGLTPPTRQSWIVFFSFFEPIAPSEIHHHETTIFGDYWSKPFPSILSTSKQFGHFTRRLKEVMDFIWWLHLYRYRVASSFWMVWITILNWFFLHSERCVKSHLKSLCLRKPTWFSQHPASLPTQFLGPRQFARLGGGFKHFLFSPLPGEMIQFD